ncbi:tetratricopeptide repeat protein [Nocardioides sp. NPDC023903]|uniref:tetratricopeptide repeat protein n=1 Tax=Nocardioides sp. NPDC023903 TaxID=3157195 RepID=UPI00340886DC
MTENEEFEYVAPAVVFPGQSAHEVAYRTAHDLLSRRFPVEALEILEPALADDPDNIGLRSMLAWAYMLRAQLAKAEAELRWLVERDPSDAWSQHSLGRVLERQDRLEDALGPLRLAAVMSDDYDHHAAVYRVRNRLAQRQE